MRVSFLQIIFLVILFLWFFYNKPIYSEQIGNFITTFIETIKKSNSFRK